MFHRDQGRLDEALELAIRAKEGCESVFGVDHKESQDARELAADIKEELRESCSDDDDDGDGSASDAHMSEDVSEGQTSDK